MHKHGHILCILLYLLLYLLYIFMFIIQTFLLDFNYLRLILLKFNVSN